MKYNFLELLALMVVYVLVLPILHCGKLLCGRYEGGMAQVEVRILMLNILGDAMEEKGISAWTSDHIGL